ncbi:MAG: general secretion pathway protein GspK [Opitutaceae bacterium]|nr:general secretion pathway protein GspK [Opitutaceae bacterium]
MDAHATDPIDRVDAACPAGRGLGPRRRRRGAVLLIVLVIIVVLSALIVQFTEKGMSEIAAEGHYVSRARLRLVAYSALETTLGVLADYVAVDGGLTSPAQGWADPLPASDFAPPEGVSVHIEFIDESGRLPLRSLDELTLVPLFTEMGFANDEVLHLTNALLDWTDTDDEERIDGAESDIYKQAEWPHEASNQPIKRLRELAVVEGFRQLFFDEHGQPNDYYRLFAETVSEVGTGTLNINSISDLALRALGGVSDPQIDALRRHLAGADLALGTADDRYFASAAEIAGVLGPLPEGIRLDTKINVLRVRVRVDEGGNDFVLEAVVQPGRGASGNLSGGRSDQNNSRPAGAPAESASGGATQVSYPFVFLEMTEDVGHNSSIAVPADSTTPVPTGRTPNP